MLLRLRKYILRPLLIVLFVVITATVIGATSPQAMVIMFPILVLVCIGLGIWWLYKKHIVSGILVIGAGLLIVWMRRGETYLLQVKDTTLSVGFDAKVAVLSDMHVGPYKGKQYVQKIVDILQQQTDVDAVFIVGDWAYEPKEGTLQEILSPLSQLQVPVYGVLGNHDVQKPGDAFIRPELEQALPTLGVTLLQNQAVQLSGGITLVGLGDERGGDADVSILSGYTAEDNLIVLAHNPDTVMRYGTDIKPYGLGEGRGNFFNKANNKIEQGENNVDITFAGHTHASQIRLFGLTNYLTPTRYEWAHDGRYDTYKVFITRGVGETAVPVRLMNRVQIDIVTFTK